MAKYTAHHPAPPNKPRENWVDKVGGLPKPIDAVMRALMAKGWAQQRAVATAVNHVKKTCATGRAFGGKTPVSAEARGVACRAVAEWEAKKARARALSLPADERRAVELAIAQIDGVPVRLPDQEVTEATFRHAVVGGAARGLTIELSQVVELAGSRAGLVPVKVTVRNRKGTTFQRTMWVRPNQAKAAAKTKGAAVKVSEKGADVQRQTRAVLEQIAAIPRDQRPPGWDRFVRAVATGPAHGGRLGGEKRRLLRDLQANAPEGSPLKAAVTSLLKSDAKPGAKPKPAAKAKREKAASPKQVTRAVDAWNKQDDDAKLARARKNATWKDDHWEGDWPGKAQGYTMMEDGSIAAPPSKPKAKRTKRPKGQKGQVDRVKRGKVLIG